MENFQFRLLTYRFEAQLFLREVAPDVLTTVPWCGSLLTCLFHTQRHVTLTTLHESFFCHTHALTHATPQLHLRAGRPIFAPADFQHSDV